MTTMNIHVAQGSVAEQIADCIIVNLFEESTTPSGATSSVDRSLDGAISQIIAGGDFTGKAGTTTLLYTNGNLPSPRVLIVGLGSSSEFNLHAVRNASATAALAASKLDGVRSIATVVHGAGTGNLDVRESAQALVEGALLAIYRSPQYRRDIQAPSLEQLTIVEFDAEKLPEIESGINDGQIIAEAVNRSRNLSSEPANVLYPAEVAGRARNMAEQSGLRCTILGEEEMRDLGMNILLAVCEGSEREPQLIILDHIPPGSETEEPLILLGKGVTFDTGGISIKSSAEMWLMKYDMTGAAVVISAMEAIARLRIPKRIIGIAPCVENMPDGKAFRPGDIYTGITGKTAEIISTDAEGRLILADSLGYAARYNPRGVVDLATLTGAVSVALGSQAAGLFSNDDNLSDALLEAATSTGERLWPLPMYDEYKDAIKSQMAEVKNSGGRYGGVSTSAKFLEHFTEGYPWAHLDIANVSWVKSQPNSYTPTGATGFGVRLLVEFAKRF